MLRREDVLRGALDFKVESQRKKGRQERIWKKWRQERIWKK